MDIQIRTDLGKGGHRDLSLTIPQLGIDVAADTYYFVLALEHRGLPVDENAIRQCIRNLVTIWHSEVAQCTDGAVVYLPFDFSDQSTGCLRVERNGDSLRLSYGFTLLEGWRVDPLNPAQDFKGIDDFKQHPDRHIDVSRQACLDALLYAMDAP